MTKNRTRKTPAGWMDFWMTAAHWLWRERYLVLLLAAILAAVVMFVLWGGAPAVEP